MMVPALSLIGEMVTEMGNSSPFLRRRIDLAVSVAPSAARAFPVPYIRTTSSTTKSGSSSTPRVREPIALWRSPLPRPWWIGSAAASIFSPRGSQATPSTARSGCSSGWWIARSHRTFRFGISRYAPTVPSVDPTLSSTGSATCMSALRANCSRIPASSTRGHLLPYRASRSDCSRCNLKARCTPSTSRKVTRDVDEDVRDRVRALANTAAFQQSRRERKKVEMRFAHMKRILKLDRLRLRGVLCMLRD